MRERVAAWGDPNSLSNRAFMLTHPPGIDFNSAEVQAAEMPSSNSIGTARSLARMYAAVIGEVDGVQLIAPDTVAAAVAEQASDFMLPTDDNPMTGPGAFASPLGHALDANPTLIAGDREVPVPLVA
ncbi:hypothetical protein ACIBCO_26825 [Streptomyces violascens]|uniref:hypothetical protein n=1 Tax=Streptomyces violascens TaxID=67381 RepID=UPI0037B6BE9E